MPLDELKKIQRAIGIAYDKMDGGDYRIGVRIFEEQLPVLDTEFRRFERVEPIDAYAYAKRLDSPALKELLLLMRAESIDELKGAKMAHPYFMLIRNLYGNVLSALVRAYGEMKEKDKAFEISKKALDVDGRNSDIWTNLGILQGGSGDLRSAAKSFRTAIRYSPQEKRLWKNFGVCCRERRRDEELALIADTLNMPDSRVTFLHNFLDLCLFGGDIPAADEATKTLLNLNPHDADAYLKLARVRALEQRNDDAIDLLKTAVKQDKNRADIHGELGRILTLKGDYRDACKEFEMALKSDSDNTEMKYLYTLTKESSAPVKSTINIATACGNRNSKIHRGVRAPLGCRILELLYRISQSNLTGVGDASQPGTSDFGTETIFVSTPDSSGADSSLVSADTLQVLDFTDIIGHEPGEFRVTYSTALSEIPYSKVPYRPKDSIMSIPVHYCTICISTADATLPEVAVNAMEVRLLDFLHLDFPEKKREIHGEKK